MFLAYNAVQQGEYLLRYEVHAEYEPCKYNEGYQHDDGCLLQHIPCRPGHLVHQLVVRSLNIGTEFCHKPDPPEADYFLLLKNIISVTLSLVMGAEGSTGTWIRTKIEGFGDLYSTIELCPYLLL